MARSDINSAKAEMANISDKMTSSTLFLKQEQTENRPANPITSKPFFDH